MGICMTCLDVESHSCGLVLLCDQVHLWELALRLVQERRAVIMVHDILHKNAFGDDSDDICVMKVGFCAKSKRVHAERLENLKIVLSFSEICPAFFKLSGL